MYSATSRRCCSSCNDNSEQSSPFPTLCHKGLSLNARCGSVTMNSALHPRKGEIGIIPLSLGIFAYPWSHRQMIMGKLYDYFGYRCEQGPFDRAVLAIAGGFSHATRELAAQDFLHPDKTLSWFISETSTGSGTPQPDLYLNVI